MFSTKNRSVSTGSNAIAFTDIVGVQRHLKVTNAAVNEFIDMGMPCLPNSNGGGLRFNVQECEAWYVDAFAAAELVSDMMGWNLKQSRAFVVKHGLTIVRDGEGNEVIDEGALREAVRHDQAEFAAKRAEEARKRTENEARKLAEAGSTEPAEEVELAA